ncbi:unnamed protein product [Knipowitschia caucasica]
MLCEGRLWAVAYAEEEEGEEASADHPSPHCSRHSSSPGPLKTPRDSGLQRTPSLQSLDLERVWSVPQRSAEMAILSQNLSSSDSPFLVPSFCQSICQNYSDLHIAGDQVLPLSANVGEFGSNKLKTAGPFLHSCDVQPPLDQSLQAGPVFPVKRGSNPWKQGSGRDRSFFLQGREGPFTNSLLNHYLEQKLQDLYQQYMMENMAKEAGSPCPLLGSELVLTSLDHLTLQLSKEGNLEAGVAKDLVLSCLLRVAGEMSGEISTPFLQISSMEKQGDDEVVNSSLQYDSVPKS